jgi:hypothetical protein
MLAVPTGSLQLRCVHGKCALAGLGYVCVCVRDGTGHAGRLYNGWRARDTQSACCVLVDETHARGQLQRSQLLLLVKHQQ